MIKGFFLFSLVGKGSSQGAEGLALKFPVFDGAGEVQRLCAIVNGSFGFVQVQIGFTQIAEAFTLVLLICNLLDDSQSLLVELDSFWGLIQVGVGQA